jgi:hypothetical protein
MAGAVMSTVAGLQTAAGLVTMRVGFVLTVTITGLIAEQPNAVVPFM